MSNKRTVYVLDTSVILSDPRAVTRFRGHKVVLPLVVVRELERKRSDPDLGYFARTALRLLEELRVKHPGGLNQPVPLDDKDEDNGSTLVIDRQQHPDARTNDERILAVAKALNDEGEEVVVVSNDLPMRLEASFLGLGAEEYHAKHSDSDWSGIIPCEVSVDQLNQLFAGDELDLSGQLRNQPPNTGLIVKAGTASALARNTPDGKAKLITKERTTIALRGKGSLTGRSAEQRIALDLLLDQDVGIVSLGGSAGTGKSLLALAAGLHAVERNKDKKDGPSKVIVFRPTYPVGGQDLGFLPGTAAEKMAPWAQAVFDALESIFDKKEIDDIKKEGILEVLPLTHIRGRSLHKAFVIVDEAQQLERVVILTALSRLSQGSRVVLTHDTAQRDNLRVGRYDGIAAVVEVLKDEPLFGHVTLKRSERSAIAEVATRLLDK